MAKNLFYKIGDACKALDIQPYVLRYWETEFSFLKPGKSKSGQRVYGEAEMAMIKRIKELLYEEGYTIAGAKKKLEAERAGEQDDDQKAAAKTAVVKGSKQATRKKGPRSKGAGKLDSDVTQEVKKLRLGLEEALSQSRDLLQKLGSAAS